MMLVQLSSHYWRPDFSPTQYRALIGDFLSDLKEFSLEEIERSIAAYRKLPDARFFPTPGALIGLMKPPAAALRRAVTAFDPKMYETPKRTTPLRPASQILAERRERDRQNNSPTPVDTA